MSWLELDKKRVVNRAGPSPAHNHKEVFMSWIVKGEELFLGMAMEKETLTHTFQDEGEAREYAADLIRDDYDLVSVSIEENENEYEEDEI